MLSEVQKEKQKNKQLILEKLKMLKIKSQIPATVPIKTNNQPAPITKPYPALNEKQQNKISAPKSDVLVPTVEKAEPIRFLGYPSGADHQYDEKQEKQIHAQKEIKKSVRAKRPYYEHYVKQGVFEPILQYVRNHPNPSGKPPNIPPQMYEGIEVIPKRPWVYFGPENIPPSDCQQINQKTFSIIFQEAKKAKGTGVFKKNGKKKNRRNEDQFSEITDQFTSNFTFSDSVDLSKQSDLISQFRSQTKTLKAYDSAKAQESQADDDFSSVSGSVTQRHRYNLFDSSQSQDYQQSSRAATKRRKKFKRLLDSSDDQKSSANRPSSFQATNSVIPPGSSGQQGSSGRPASGPSVEGSSVKAVLDKGESPISESKSKSKQSYAQVKKGKLKKSRVKIQDSDDD